MQIKRLIVGPIETNCYLLISGNEMVVVDPGGDPDIILNEIEKTGIKLKYIINTHYHFDHVLANKEIQQATGAEIIKKDGTKALYQIDPSNLIIEEINLDDKKREKTLKRKK